MSKNKTPQRKPPANVSRPAQATTQISVARQQWQGPLPPPSDLSHFDFIVPGSAERIIKMAEEEGEHNRAMESRERGMHEAIIKATSREQLLGQTFALVISLVGLLGAIYLAMHDHTAAAIVVGGTPLATIVLAFLGMRSSKK